MKTAIGLLVLFGLALWLFGEVTRAFIASVEDEEGNESKK